MEKLFYKRFLLVKDNFYNQPETVYKAAMQAEYYEPEHATGFRSKEVYHEQGVKQKLEKILGIKITRWDTDPLEENGVFYQGFADGNRKEVPGVHSDEPYNDMTIVVYLTPNLPFDCGTSLWQHKQSGLFDPAMPADARRLKMKLSDLRQQLEKESMQREKWNEVDRVGYRFNRMVAYPSGVFHSATRHYGQDNTNGRLYQTFRVGVDWNSFKLAKV
ncbi:MAG: hypothetical protein IT236_01285 [Bacteroidia bacterium]|nr:hypothetical protein [Bacteroidia bacterium]